VTGGGSGIGLATARALREHGTVIVADVSDDAIAGAQDEGFETYHLDVRSTASWRALVAALRERHGRLDGLVHNAGIAPIAPLIETSDATVDDVLATNVRSILVGTRESWGLLAASRGSVVVVASVAALVGQDRSAAYVASKGAAVAVTRALALELAPHGVRVNSVCPGTTMTPMLRRHFASLPEPEEVVAHSVRRHPIGRLLVPEDIAPSIVHLLLPERSGAMTGANVVVDGGLTASFDYGNAFAGGGVHEG
jgi:NAD(P)-dependent dehydrogenase (short-subunit alcohol dehydrogenase family)